MSDKEQLSTFGSFRRNLLKVSGGLLAYSALSPLTSFANQSSDINSSPGAGLKVNASSIDSKGEALTRLGNMVEQGASEAELLEGASVTYLNLNEHKRESFSYAKAYVEDGKVAINHMAGDETGKFSGSFKIENSVLQPSKDGKSVVSFTESATLNGGFLSAALNKDRVRCSKSIKDRGTKCELIGGAKNGETIKELEDVFDDVLDNMVDGKDGNAKVSKKLDRKKGLYAVSEGGKVKEMHCTLKDKPNASLADKIALQGEAKKNLSTMMDQDFFQADVDGGLKYKSTSKTTVSAENIPQPLMSLLLNNEKGKDLTLAPETMVPKPEVLHEPKPVDIDRRQFLQQATLLKKREH